MSKLMFKGENFHSCGFCWMLTSRRIATTMFNAVSTRNGTMIAMLSGTPFHAILIAIALTVGMFGHAAMYGPQASFLSELFGARVRYSGISIGYQLASVFAGGLSPVVATALLDSSGHSATPIAIYMLVLAGITLVAIILVRETFKEDVSHGVTVETASPGGPAAAGGG